MTNSAVKLSGSNCAVKPKFRGPRKTVGPNHKLQTGEKPEHANRNRNLPTIKATLKSQAQGTSLFKSEGLSNVWSVGISDQVARGEKDE